MGFNPFKNKSMRLIRFSSNDIGHYDVKYNDTWKKVRVNWAKRTIKVMK
jgi:hypothetical protein